ncbi:MAG: TetR/AcrR family transcriptional regulator [Candidatus Methylomirabilales bacterium]
MSERWRGQRRRRQIIEAAASLFAQKGFRGTTTREIAEVVGVSEAALFKYFATKEKLYTAIIDSKAKTEEVVSAAGVAAQRWDDRGVFEAVALTLMERTTQDTTLMRLLLFSALEGHELSTIFFEIRVRKLHQFLSRYVEERISQGVFREVDPLLAARSFVGMVIHYLLIHELFGVKRSSGHSTKKAVETFVNLFLGGISKAPPVGRDGGRRNRVSPSSRRRT